MVSWTATRMAFADCECSIQDCHPLCRLLNHSCERQGDYSTSEGELQKRARIPGRLLDEDMLPRAVVQKLAAIPDDETFWSQVLNPRLFELGVSHRFALPAELAREMEPLTFATGSHRMAVDAV